jgi:hypothetical protein
VVPREKLSFILGNPPFLGKKEQSPDQKADLLRIFSGVQGAGVLDYVSCWFLLAARYAKDSKIEFGFVATNSVTQGEQVGLLWPVVFQCGPKISFAHRTFKWSNEAKGLAAVHCVIIGMAFQDRPEKSLYSYSSPTSAPYVQSVGKINAYLVDADNVFLPNRSEPLCAVPKLLEGVTPLDDGHLSLDEEGLQLLLSREPSANKWIRRWLTGHSFINNTRIYCLWLSEIDPASLRRMPAVMEMVERVRAFRLGSKSSRSFASRPWQFREIVFPERFLLIPKSSSESRQFLPMGVVEGAIASNACLVLPGSTTFHFGVLASTMHMAWMRNVGGRLKSDYRYSAGIVYNNYPWPDPLDDKARAAIEAAAQGVLDARAEFPDSTLADLYDPLTMPPALVKAHQKLDHAVDAAYLAAEKAAGRKPPRLNTDAERVAFLFERYQALVSLLPTAKPAKSRRRKAGADASDLDR